jgi:hypothetical protein
MATYAGRYDEVLLKISGRMVLTAPSAAVHVLEEDGVTPAVLYTNRVKNTTAPNPTSTDASSNLEFFADPGNYILRIFEGDTLVRTDYITVPVEPSEVGRSVPVQAEEPDPELHPIWVDTDAGEEYDFLVQRPGEPALGSMFLLHRVPGGWSWLRVIAGEGGGGPTPTGSLLLADGTPLLLTDGTPLVLQGA